MSHITLESEQTASFEIVEKQNTKDPMLYYFWPSQNRICLKGYLMTGPKEDIIHNLFTWFMITGISVSFFVLCAPYIWLQVHWLFVAFIIYLFTSTLVFLALTQFTDPGIVPRKEIFELLEIQESVFLHNLEDQEVRVVKDVAPKVVSVQQEDFYKKEAIESSKRKKKFGKAQTQKSRICPTCKIVKIQRMYHCKECGNCVQVFDHHCPFVNNCVGKRNYRYFLGFLISLLLLGIAELGGFLIIFIRSFGEGIDNGKSDIVIHNSTILVVILSVIGIPTFFFILCVLVLSCFHVFLMFKGKTTKEKLGKQPGNFDQSGQQIQLKQSVDWCRSSPSMFSLRQFIKNKSFKYEIKQSKKTNI